MRRKEREGGRPGTLGPDLRESREHAGAWGSWRGSDFDRQIAYHVRAREEV
jgi:hypothetical protein